MSEKKHRECCGDDPRATCSQCCPNPEGERSEGTPLDLLISGCSCGCCSYCCPPEAEDYLEDDTAPWRSDVANPDAWQE